MDSSVERALPLRRNSGFRLLWIGQVISSTGSEAALIAYPLLVLVLTGSAVIAGAVGTAALAARLALGLPGGALSDRFDRRLTMIVCDGVRAVGLALLTALVLVHLATWPVVLAVAVVDEAANALFDPSANAAVPDIVPDGQLEQAWAATEARGYAASLAGPALGGFLFGLGRAVPFLVDALSYLVSVAAVSRIRGRFRPEPAAERRALLREAADGVRLVLRNPLLRAVLIQAPLVNFAFNGVIFTITVALRQHGSAPAVIGVAQAGIAAGGLLGAVAAARLQRRLPMRRMVIGLNVADTVLFALAALILPSPLVAIPVAAALLLAPAANAALSAAEMRTTPEHMRGRVSGTVFLGAMSMAALAPLAAGLLVQHTSGRWAIAAFAAATGVAAVLAVTLRGLR
ncbi:MAG TPA: MFS transporter [Pseudonocardiaceae bacterium]|nr:MFS transporter [Pseudonocardiaceae bacterium]